MWEQRRRAWLDNAGSNRFFWYSFVTTALLIISWFAVAWSRHDRLRERWELSQLAADALRFGEHCKCRAAEAIGRYNEHVEKCNRVIESAEFGMTTPETATLDDFKTALQKLRADNDALTAENTRLREEAARRTTDFEALIRRVTEAEQRMQANRAGSKSVNAELVERVRRLEEENRQLQQQANRARSKTPGDGGMGAATE